MRLLVTGGRDFTNRELAFSALNKLDAENCIDVVIHGAAKGADTLAARWCAAMNVPVWPFPAEWRRHQNAAGPIRNQRMIDEAAPSHVLAFSGGNGTADMVRRARAANIPVIEVPAHVH
ncbi:DUF2493 domain-containing protein [Bosea sp. AS-1]|uniref:DUF2493 domain-containing protein n=1 Tax=Bosea sp. AS-1 TaxID=2015316 RepID=UPI000B76C918|nr:DUF2493 domain-containing protein [Bosea sp. AS-1]